MPENQSTLQVLADAIAMWRVVPHEASRPLVDAATQSLVDGLDGPNLRMLAGASASESQFVIGPLVEATAEELGLGDVLAGDASMGALGVVARRFLAGEIDARQLGRWAHRHVGHQGVSRGQPFVNLDDLFDTIDFTDRDEPDLVAAARAEAVAFTAGEASPGLL